MVVGIGDVGDHPSLASASIGLGVRNEVNRISTTDEQVVVDRDIVHGAEIVFDEYRSGLTMRIDDRVVLDIQREVWPRTTAI